MGSPPPVIFFTAGVIIETGPTSFRIQKMRRSSWKNLKSFIGFARNRNAVTRPWFIISDRIIPPPRARPVTTVWGK